MRYVSLVFLVFLMWWSRTAINAPALLPEDTHVGIQEDLRRVISDYIAENVEGATGLRFEKFWTETVKENQIKATFSYSFEESSSEGQQGPRVGIDGHAILNRSKEENSEFDVWNLDELYVQNNTITFQEGITVQSASKDK